MTTEEYYRNHKKEENKKRRIRRILANYNFTLEEYNRMYEKQEGKCAICGINYPVLCVDHHHSTGKVRGLLCRKCNLLLGNANDDMLILSKAIEYLR